jgi:hypothetical protein
MFTHYRTFNPISPHFQAFSFHFLIYLRGRKCENHETAMDGRLMFAVYIQLSQLLAHKTVNNDVV